jgi:SAM-dependent methyltransferase
LSTNGFNAQPPQLGSPEQLSSVRNTLRKCDYDEPSICRRLGTEVIPDYPPGSEVLATAQLADALDALIYLLILGWPLDEARLRGWLSPEGLAAFEAVGLLRRLPGARGELYATAFLIPVHGLYVASDRKSPPRNPDLPLAADFVYPANSWNSRQFLLGLPHWPCDDLLDLCSGSGVAALLAAAGWVGHAWACDVTERCTVFAEFNRRLNGIENVTPARGDLYEPVQGRTFDCIVMHPPCLPSSGPRMIFADGGDDGEQVLRRAVEGLPEYLRAGGRFYCFTLGTDRQGEQIEQRIRRWLGPAQDDFHVVLISFETGQNTGTIARKGGRPESGFGPLTAHSELYLRLKVTAYHYGAIVIERKRAGSATVTARTRKADPAGRDAVEWFAAWATASSDPGFDDVLLHSRPRLAPAFTLNVAHTVQNQRLVPTRFELRCEYPFSVASPCPKWVAMLAGACDGSRTALEVFEQLKQQKVLNSSMTEAQFAHDLREMISHGFVEIDELRLPQPPSGFGG